MAATSVYSWKSTDELNKKNQANTMANAMRGAGAPAFGAPAAGSLAAPGAGVPDTKPLATPGAAPSAGVSAFAVPKTMAEAMRQPTLESNMGLAQKNIEAGFGPLPSGPADALARNQLQKTIDAGAQKVADTSTLAGRGATGQRGGDLADFYQTSAIPAKAELEGQLQANRMTEEHTRAQESQQNLQTLAGQASQEKVAYAQLSQADKELAQKASQFTDQLQWEQEATKLGLDDKAMERAWQSGESLKEREARATTSSLDRELQKYLGDRKLDIDDKQLAETIRQFDTREAFDKWATQAGLDAQAAELIWKSNESDVQRKWETGERLSTEDHHVNLARLQGEIDNGKAKFAQALNIKTMEKQAEIDALAAAVDDEYMTARETRAMSHEESMAVLKTSLTAKLEQAGYDHQTAMQAAEIQAESIAKAQDRAMESKLAQAELAYKYKALADETGLSQQEVDIKRQAATDQMAVSLKQLGLDETRINASINSQEFRDRAGVISSFIELAGDNVDAADKAAAMFVDLMSDPKLPGGALLTPEQKAQALKGIQSGAATAGAGVDQNILLPKTGSKMADTAVDGLEDHYLKPLDDLSKGNWWTAAGGMAGNSLAPFKLAKSLKWW